MTPIGKWKSHERLGAKQRKLGPNCMEKDTDAKKSQLNFLYLTLWELNFKFPLPETQTVLIMLSNAFLSE